MPYTTLIDADTLGAQLGAADWCLVDCRFDLNDTDHGRREYVQAHIPGAVYAHLDHDLSGPPVTDRGRHPLPSAAALRATFSRWGIGPQTQVVAYDSAGGMLAGRLWWMLRYMGHTAVAVLDGGWQAWQAAGLPVIGGVETRTTVEFRGEPHPERLVTLDEVDAQPRLIDSRDAARYRGEAAGPDPRAGRIPGAAHRHWAENLTDDGKMRPRGELEADLVARFAGVPSADITWYCGSGVSACLNILAQVHAGLPEGRLYVGSWSEWSGTDRPIARGAAGEVAA